jgi:glycosyltransferase involved in cell wall biosynthesis
LQTKQIIILHDLNGKPYYEAIEYYAQKNNIKVIYYESSILKLFIRDIIKKQFSINTFKRSWKNLIFRLKVPFVENKTIIMGMAPYDFRIIWYKKLLNTNNLIYNTSNPFWGDDSKTPRKYGIFTKFLKKYWVNFLKDKRLKIVTVTKSAYNTLTTNFTINGNIKQIYHTVDTSRFKNIKIDNDGKLHILFVGKLLYEKGLDTVVKLVENMDKNKYYFHIVGDGEYKKHIEHIFSNENVTYHGWISDKENLAKIYQKCQIFLNPSIKNDKWQELFGLVNIEAMASGLVVIASNHIGPSEIIDDKKNGFLVEEKNYMAIKQIIEQLCNDNKLLLEISNCAIKSSKNYSVENISQKWERIINE